MQFVEEHRRNKGITTRNISPKEIEERVIFGLINEGFKCLDDGIAMRPMDIDIIWIFGYT
eukprot:UN20576